MRRDEQRLDEAPNQAPETEEQTESLQPIVMTLQVMAEQLAKIGEELNLIRRTVQKFDTDGIVTIPAKYPKK